MPNFFGSGSETHLWASPKLYQEFTWITMIATSSWEGVYVGVQPLMSGNTSVVPFAKASKPDRDSFPFITNFTKPFVNIIFQVSQSR